MNVVPADGIPRRIAGYEGESLLQVIERNRIPGMPGKHLKSSYVSIADCNGGDNELKPYQIPYDFYSAGVGCATCQVVIPDPWYDKVNKLVSLEQTRLLRQNSPQSTNTRLACCI